MLIDLDEKGITVNQAMQNILREHIIHCEKKKKNNKQISYFGMISANNILQQKNTTSLEKIVQIAACNMMKTASTWKGNGWQELM